MMDDFKPQNVRDAAGISQGRLIVFVPFTRQELLATPETIDKELRFMRFDQRSELAEWANGRMQAPGKKYEAILYGDDHKELLESLGKNDTVYVTGHGGAGLDLLATLEDTTDPDCVKINAEELLDRLQASGLSPEVGKIKLFCCHSNEGNENSFAEKFRQAQESKQAFSKTEVSSYRGEVDIHSHLNDPARTKAKTSEMDGTTVRASVNAYVRTAEGDVPRKTFRAG